MYSKLEKIAMRYIPSRIGIILSHPLEIMISVVMIVYGVEIMRYGELPSVVHLVTREQEEFTPVFSAAAFALGSVFLLGGTSSLVGKILLNVRVEATGMILMFIGALYYTIMSSLTEHISLLQLFAQSSIALALLSKSIFLWGQLLINKITERK